MAKPATEPQIAIGLNAAIVAVEALTPLILVVDPPDKEQGRGEAGRSGPESLPTGPFNPPEHRTLEIGLRSWVAAQTALEIGYVEQLYTFGDRGRHAEPGDIGPHVMSVGYLALTRIPPDETLRTGAGAHWRSWYRYFPWEDWREGRPAVLDREIVPRLDQWAAMPGEADAPWRGARRRERIGVAFGLGDLPWDEELALDRFEILYEAGLVDEAGRDGRRSAAQWTTRPATGVAMHFDHRRILATAISRLRGKIKYRP
ncbi:MAG: NAD regulator, partial [Alphaproteobacteria bacterium]